MSSQAIKDYLIKQLFIEKNVVTYRSLSRKFEIHVNVARDELALYHEQAPYDSQISYATYLLSGVEVPGKRARSHFDSSQETPTSQESDMDMGMDFGDSTQGEDAPFDDGEEEVGDYEDVPMTTVTIVNEKDLEEAKARYRRLNSIQIYSLSPSPIHDAGLLCTPTESVRSTDNAKGEEQAKRVGRVVAPNIKVKPIKPKAPVAGPSKLKDESKSASSSKSPSGDVKMKDQSSANAAKSKDKAATDKVKPTGKIEFKPKAKEPVVVKKEEPAPAAKESKKMFFMTKPGTKKPPPTTKAASPPPSVANQKLEPAEKPKRGLKRKSLANDLDDSDAESTATSERKSASVAPPTRPVSRAASTKHLAVESKGASSSSNLRLKRGIVLSDDEDEAPVASRRKVEAVLKAKKLEEKEAKELMDIDDDAVERVVRRESVSTRCSKPETEAEEDEEAGIDTHADTTQELDTGHAADEDVEMEDETTVVKAKPKKKREKKVIPVGRNGLKKKEIMKTRMVTDENGYLVTQDYVEWESVDEEAETQAPKPSKGKGGKGRSKASAAAVKPEPEDSDEELELKSATAKTKTKTGTASSSVKARSRASSVASSVRAPATTDTTTKAAAPAPATKAAPTKTALRTGKSSGGTTVKSGQKSIANFFGRKSVKK